MKIVLFLILVCIYIYIYHPNLYSSKIPLYRRLKQLDKYKFENSDNITIACSSGLSNRIRTVLGFYYICKKQNKHLTVLWPTDEVCNGYFLDYYKPIPGITFKNEYQHSEDIYFTGQDTIPSILNKHNFKHQKSISYYLYSILKVRDKIWEKIKSFVKTNDIKNSIGLHVRRTDFTGNFLNNCINGANLDQDFFSYVNNHKGKYSNIYLACDNYKTQKIFKIKYKDNLKFFKHINYNTNLRQTSLVDAIIDMYILSFCKYIKGTNNSSFSKTAKTLKSSRIIYSE